MRKRKLDKKNPPSTARKDFVFEELEPRLLLSADLPINVPDAYVAEDFHDQEILQDFDTQQTESQQQDAVSLELIFVDTDTPEYQTLLSDLLTYPDDTTRYQVFELDNTRDGIAQITEILGAYNDVSAVHILSHGGEGAIDLGGSTLDSDALSANAERVSSWGGAFTDEGDILIYGCNLAATSEGQMLVNSIATLTGADVAASDDLTGNAQLGGDWELEYSTGSIETTVAISSQAQNNWSGVLAFAVNTTDDTPDANPGDGLAEDGSGNISLRSAIEEANALGGAHTINLLEGTYTLSGGELSITSDLTIVGADAVTTIIDANSIDRVFYISTGSLTLSDATVTGGAADRGAGFKVDLGATLNLSRAVVSNNVTTGAGGGFYSMGTVIADQVRFTSNQADLGGGFTNAGSATITNSLIDGNTAAFGGGIRTTGNGTDLTLENVTISGNTATTLAGGIQNSKLATLTNVTITDNRAAQGGGIAVGSGSVSTFMLNTIVAGNTQLDGTTPDDIDGNIDSLGYNIIADITNSGGWVASDQLDVDPLLGALADNGGPTLSHALLTGSTAIDAGTSTGAPLTDQRGTARDDGFIDIGAYEFDPSLPAAIDLDGDDSSGTGGGGYAATWTEAGGAMAIVDTDAVVTDVDDTHLESLTVSITNLVDVPNEILGFDTSGTSIAGSYDAATGVLTLSGTDTVANYQLVLRTITYNNTSSVSSDIARIVTFVANDGSTDSNIATTTITVNATNAAPVNAVPVGQSTPQDTDLVFSSGNGNAISVSDPDAGANTVEITLAATNGTLTLNGGGGLVTVGNEITTNTDITYVQTNPTVAMDAAGGYVAVWQSTAQDTDQEGIFAQRYDADGIAVGSAWQVNTEVANDQSYPAIAMDAAGNFVITWQSYGQDKANSWGIYAQRYSADGTVLGSEFLVNTSSTSNHQNYPDIAMDSSGNFVIVWQGDGAGDSNGVFGQRFNNLGVAQGGEFLINTYITDTQWQASVDMNASGEFVVAWSSQIPSSSSWEVNAQIFNADGSVNGSEFKVSDAITGSQNRATVVMKDNGEFVIGWVSGDINARVFDASGTALTGDFAVNTTTTGAQTKFDLALTDDDGFIATWGSPGQNISMQKFDWSGTAIGAETQVNSTVSSTRVEPTIASNANGDYVVLWRNDFEVPDNGIYAQHYVNPGLVFSSGDGADDSTMTFTGTIADINTVLEGATFNPDSGFNGTATVTITTDDQGNTGSGGALSDTDVVNITVGNPNAPVINLDADDSSAAGGNNFTATWIEDAGAVLVADIDATFIDADENLSSLAVTITNLLDGMAESLTANAGATGLAVAYNSGTGVLTISGAGTAAQYQQVLRTVTYNNTSDAPNTTARVITFTATDAISNGNTASTTLTIQATNDAPVNAVPVDQSTPQDTDLVFSSGNGNALSVGDVDAGSNEIEVTLSVDNGTLSINGSGNTVGNEFLVNTEVIDTQLRPATAMREDGSFVMAWSSINQDGSGYGVFAQIFDANGDKVGGEFQVNSYTNSTQTEVAVAVDDAGNFTIVWKSYGQDKVNTDGIYGQRYDANGNTLGIEFLVNTYTTGHQTDPDIAMDASGNFVVVWSGESAGDAVGIHAQLFDASGNTVGAEIDVNSYTTDLQEDPSVAMDDSGNFVVVWRSDNQDGDAAGIYAQRFNASGVAQGIEFRVNETTISSQYWSDVSMDADGDFVVAWTDSVQGLMARVYNSSGVDQTGEFSTGISGSNGPTVAMDANGNFTVARPESNEVSARSFDMTGTALGDVFQVNTTSPGIQPEPDIAMNSSGDYVIAWDGTGTGDTSGIFAQRYSSLALTFTNGDGIDDSKMTFTGTLADINVALEGMNYTPNGGYNGVDTLTITTNDQGNTGAGGALQDVDTVNITVGNPNAAIIDLNGGDGAGNDFVATWSEDGGAVAVVDTDATMVDGDENLTSVTVTITNLLDGTAESLSANPGATGLSVSYNSGTGVLTISGAGTAAQYQQVLRTVTYNNTSNNPNATARVITFTATDAISNGNTATTTLTIDAVNDAPVNAVPGAQTTAQDTDLVFSSGNGNTITVSDVDADTVEVTLTATNGTVTVDLGGTAGVETLINSTTTDVQRTPDIAVAADGSYVVAWASQNQDGDGWGIYAQSFDATGTAISGEILVNGTTTGDQINPSVAIDDAGNFVVAWETNHLGTGYYNIFAQRFDASGNTVGGEFQVDAVVGGDVINATVAMDADGDFVIAFENHFASDGDGWGIYAHRYDSGGASQGGAFLVNSTTAGNQAAPSAAMDDAGNFVVAWGGPVGANQSILFQRYDSNGNTVGGETVVTSTGFSASVSVNASGEFVVVWQSADTSSWGVYGRQYDATGIAVGAEFQVNTYETDDQTNPDVALADNGEFTVAWYSLLQDANPGWGVYGQRYDAAGSAVDGEFLINSTTAGAQYHPAIGVDANGRLAVTWDGNSSGDADGINVKRYGVPVAFSAGDGIDDATITFSGSIADVNAALDGLIFTPTTSFNGAASLQVQTSDLGGTGTGGILSDDDTINITVGSFVNDAPTQVNNIGLTAVEGATTTITNTELRFTDTEQSAANVNYTVTTTPANGQLELTTNPGVAITSFTQAQIDANQVVYVHDGTATTSDEFKFDVDDGQGNTTLGQFVTGITNETNLTNNAADTERDAVWSPDGTQIAFYSDRDGNNEIYVMDADGSNVVRLTNDAGSDNRPSWSPDGSQIVFQSTRGGNNDIYVIDADGTNETRLTNHAAVDGWPEWSPDGTQIAFMSGRDGNNEIYVMDADGSNQTRITNDTANDKTPSWSPDGTQLAFVRDDNIWVMDAGGTNLIQLTDNGDIDGNPSWSPDGTRIAFHTDRDGNYEIYVMDADGSNLTRLTSNGGIEGNPEWSPDGSQILFHTNRDGNYEIYVADVRHENRFAITVTPVVDNTAPTQANNTGSTVTEGGTDTIASTELSYTDSQQTAANVTYTVNSGPSNGQFELTTDPGNAVTTWSQAQIDANEVVYVHDDSNTTSDSITFTVDDGQGNSLAGQSFAITVNAVNDAPTGSVTIAGVAIEDQSLTASNTLADADGLGVISYQWQRDGSDIAGATASTYTLTDADVGATITVVASYTDLQGTNESVASAGVGPIANVNNAPVDLQATATTDGGISLNADGGNDVYFVADDGAGLLGGLTTVTIETSFSITTPGADLSPLLSYADGANDEELALFLKSDGRIWFGASSNGSPLASTAGFYTQLFDGEKHQVSVSWDASNGAVDFYIDGQLMESITGYQTGATITGTGELVFGQDQDSVLGGFKTIDVFSGELYDVRIFNDVRTAGEIAGSYDLTLPNTEPGMIANWTFNDLSTGGVITDSVSGNNLTEQHVVGAGFSTSTPSLSFSIPENSTNGTTIGSVVAIDPDTGDSFAYTLVDDAGGRFTIDSATGQITLVDTSLIDYETATSHNVTIRVTDAGGLTYDEVFTISVLNANDSPAITSDGGGATANVNVAENTSSVTTVTATDADLDTLTYSLDPASDDDGFFTINSSTGVLSFTAAPDYETAADLNGDNVYEVTVLVSDGSGGVDSQAISVTVTDANDQLSATNTSQTKSYTEDDPSVALDDIVVTDVDTAEIITATLTLSDTGAGSLTTSGTASYNAGTGVWTITDTVVNVNAALALTSFTPAANYDQNTTIAVNITDGGENSTTSVTGTINLNVTPVNDAPSVNTTGTPLAYIENDGAIAVDAGITLSDIDSTDLTGATVRITSGFASTEDALAFVDQSGITGSYDAGTGIMTLSGTASVADYQAALRSVTYENASEIPSTTNRIINFQVMEGAVSASSTRTVTVASINDDPTNSGSLPTDVTVTEDVMGFVDLSMVSLSDVDASNGLVTVTLTTSTGGKLWASSDFDVTVLGGGTGTLTLTGGISDLNNFFSSAFRFQYQHGTTHTEGDNADTIQIEINDNGNTGTGGSGTITLGTVNVDITPVNDNPVANADTGTTAEDVPLNNINVLGNDTDVDGDTLSVTGATAVNGTVTVNGDGTLNYTPNLNYNGTDAISYDIADGNGGTATGTLTITVTAVNDNPVANADSATTAEDVALNNIDVLGNDTDVDGDTLSVTGASALNGTVTVNGDGTLNYTPNLNFNGTDTISYDIADGNGGIATGTLTITVTAVNDNPVANADAATTAEDVALNNIDVLGNDTDVDGDTLSVTGASALNGTVTVNGDGSLNYTPNLNFNGTDTISYDIADGNGGTATGTLTITVTAVNDNPVANADSASTNEDIALNNIDVLGNDTDVDGDTLSVTGASALNGTVTVNGDGTLNYTPNLNFNGTDTISYDIADGNGGTATGTLTITVTAVNDNPVANADSASTNEDIALNNIDVLGNDTDVDGDTLSVTGASALSGTVTVNGDGTLNYTPNLNFNGTDTISYDLSDGNGGTATGTLTITVMAVNDNPVANADTASTNEDVALNNIDVLGNDTDVDGDTLSVTGASALNGAVTVNGDGTLSYTPNLNFNGTDTISYDIADGNGGTATGTLTISVTAVNDNPVANADSASTNEDIALNNIDVLGNDTDVDGDTLSVTGASALSGTVTVNGDGTLNYTPNLNFNGTDTISYDLSDGNGGTAIGTLTITVTAVNNNPVANADSATTAEDVALNNINVLGNDTDVDGDALSVTGASALNGTVTVNGDGTLNYTPNLNFNGTDTISYDIADGNGGTDTGTLTITVTAVNDNPVANADTASTNEDVALNNIDVLANDTDVDGDTLSVTGASALNGTVTVNGDGTLNYTPNLNFNGTDTISYDLSDGNGGTAIGTLTITVTAVNNNPVANADSATTAEDVALNNINVLGNDTDVDGDTLSVTGASALNGTVTVNGDGSLNYTPNLNFNGTDTISYDISDGNGGTATGTLTITVTAVNDNPVANADSATTAEDVALNNIDVLGNDTDVDGDTLSVTGATALNGTVTVNGDGTLNYTPNLNFNGTDTISYDLSDGNGGTATGTLTITVTTVNDNPVANADTASTNEDVALNNIDVLANDTDVDGDTLSVTGASALSGTVTVNGDGTLNYTPNLNFNGTDTISYDIADGNGGTATGTLTITVTAVNDNPVANADTATTAEDVALNNIDVLGNDTDVDGDTLSVTGATAINGTVTVSGDGTLNYTPNLNFNGTDTISYDIADGNGGTATGTLTITVTAVNNNPVANADTGTTTEDVVLNNIDVLGNDTDVDGDTLSVTGATAVNGTVTVNGDGSLNYTPSLNFNGTDTISYDIADGNGGTATGTLTITVTAVNDNPVANADAATTAEDVALNNIDVLGNDTDVDGDTLSVTGASALSGTVSVNGDGTLNYTPSLNFNGTDTISYDLSDGNGGTATGTLTITVTAVNDNPVANADTASTNEDVALNNIDVLGNDTDVDGDTLSVTGASALNGTVTVNGDGTLNYTPNLNFNGTDTISYDITDGNGGTATGTLTITVTAVNDNPVANADTVTTAEDVALNNIDVLGNDTDVDGDTLSVTGASALNGTVTVNGDGTLNYTPSLNFNGTDTISYDIADGNGGTATGTLTITVTAVNDNPVANADTASTNEDVALNNIDVLGNDTDVDGDTLSVTAATALNGTVTVNGDGTLNYTPNLNFNGTDTISYDITDGNGGTATGTLTITVTAVNDNPVANADTATTAEDVALNNIDVLGNDTDVDGDTLSVTGASALNGTVTVNGDGTLNYTPNLNFNGTDTISYDIADGNGGTATGTLTITVTAVNDNPVANADSVTTAEDVALNNIDVLGNDTDVDGDTLSVTGASALNGTVTVNGDGTLNYTPNLNFNGTDTISYDIADGNGGTATGTLTITVTAVNDNPVANADTASTTEDVALNNIDVLGNDTDVDGDTLSVTGASALNGTVTVNGDGTLNYTPNLNFNGTDTISYDIADGNGGTATGTLTISVTAVNDNPVANADTASTNEDVALNNIDVLGNDTDVDGDTLSVTGASALNGTVTVNGDGTLNYTPNLNFNGTDTISYDIADGNGGTATGTLTITVTAVNDNPVANADTGSTTEDVALNNIDVLGNDTDVDGDTLSVTGASALNGTVTVNGDGTLNYTPNLNFNGTDTISYDIADGNSGAATGTLTITVTAVNDNPVANADTATTAEDVYLSNINVLANDSDVEGDALSVTGASALNGTVTVNGDGSLNYTPNLNFNGTDTISYDIADGNGGTATGTLTITVTAVNDNPVANADTATTAEDVALNNIDVLGNDTDVDGDTLSVTGASALNGTVTVNGDGTLNYTPNLNFNGTDTISYDLSDGNGGTATGMLTITVTAVNDNPVANADTASTNEDVALNNIDVLGNDTDVDGDTLSVTGASALNGTVTVNGDGTLNYTPNLNFNGTDTISYDIADGNGGTATGTLTITVTAVNDNPVANADTASTNEDVALNNIDVLGNDTDVDGDILSLTGASALNGMVTVNGDGTLNYTPNLNFNGTDTISYDIADGNGGTATGTLTITVTAVNDNPVANADTASTNEDVALNNIDVLGNDTDVDGDTLSVTGASALNGTVTVNGDGTLNYTPNLSFNGTDTISYDIADGNGGTATGTLTITVTAVNDNPVANTDTATTAEDVALNNIDVLANDTDVDGDTLSVTGASAANGSVTINPDGTLNYTPDANFHGADTISYDIADGNGGASNTGRVDLTVSAVNDAPINTTPAGQTISAGMPLVFSSLDGNSISVVDTDGAGTVLKVTLTASNGTLSLSGTSGLAFSAGDGVADGVMTFTGTAADINAALDGLLFQPDADYQGFATVQLITDDLGNYGAGGVLNAVDSVSISVVENAPVIDNLPPLDELIIDFPGAVPSTTVLQSTAQQETTKDVTDSSVDSDVPDAPVMPSSGGLRASGEVSVQESIASVDGARLEQSDDSPIATRVWNAIMDPLVNLQMLTALPPGAMIWDFLDLMTDQITSDNTEKTDFNGYVLGTTATGVTFAFSAGYVSWLLRAGYLSAALLSSAPMWRQLDPLPILSKPTKKKGKNGEHDQDSPESGDREVEDIFNPDAHCNPDKEVS